MKNNYKKSIEKAVDICLVKCNLHPTHKEIKKTKSGFIHIHMTIPEFANIPVDKRDLIFWSCLEDELTHEEIVMISVCVLSAPDEVA
ncbi:MAG: hypothetical protein HQK49_00010 [Oligoflexia bacterium]|nr:hypothetical protein [Oligoflexia bacterium]